jgi:hypothetical protein
MSCLGAMKIGSHDAYFPARLATVWILATSGVGLGSIGVWFAQRLSSHSVAYGYS